MMNIFNDLKSPSSKEKKLVCMTIDSFHVGGCELQLISFCKELKKRNLDIIILHSQNKTSCAPPIIDGVRIFLIPRFFLRAALLPLYMRFLFDFKLGKTPDIFHCHARCLFTEQVLWYAQQKKIKTIVKITEEKEVLKIKEETEQRRSLAYWICHPFLAKKIDIYDAIFGKKRLKTYSNVDAFLSINSNIEQELRDFLIEENKIASIPNGVDPEKFHPVNLCKKKEIKKLLGLPEEQKLILMAARFVERKRFEYLIRAWSQLASDYPDYTLILVGDGIERKKCETLTLSLKIASRVIFTGMQEKMNLYFQAADLFAFASRGEEGLPNVILQAMSSALPIIASRIGGTKEVIEPGKEGLLFEPNDFLGLTEGLRSLIENPEYAEKLGTAARDKILAKYAFNKVVPQFLLLYESLLKE